MMCFIYTKAQYTGKSGKEEWFGYVETLLPDKLLKK